MKWKIIPAAVLLPVLCGACSPGYPAGQTCIERDIRSGYCIKAEFSCKRWAPGSPLLIFSYSEARCVQGE